MTLLSTQEWGPECRQVHQEPWRGADYVCVRCGGDICDEHTFKCFYCQWMKRMPWYCPNCAGDHELMRTMRGGCKSEWEHEWYLQTHGNMRESNFKGMQQRAAERQDKRNITPEVPD